MKSLLAILILFSCLLDVKAEQNISGEISGTLSKGDYIVNGILHIPEGAHLRIEPGANLYFEQFSGITVFGGLHCEGDADNPIVLTTINEKPGRAENVTPEPFDWNGVEVSPQAKQVSIINTKIRNSTFGVNFRSGETKIQIENTEFFNNGYTSIAKEDKMVAVQPGVPFSVSWNIEQTHQNQQPIQTDKKLPVQKETTPKKGKLIYKIGTATIAAGAAVVFGIATINRREYGGNYLASNNTESTVKYKEFYNKSRSTQIAAGVGTAIAVLGFGISFAF